MREIGDMDRAGEGRVRVVFVFGVIGGCAW